LESLRRLCDRHASYGALCACTSVRGSWLSLRTVLTQPEYLTYHSSTLHFAAGLTGEVSPRLYCASALSDQTKALKGADHLDFIVQNRLYRPRSTPTIEDLYDEVAPESPDFNFVTAAQVEEKTAPEEKIILTAESHVKISKRLQVPELSGEIERAVWQVEQAMKKDGQEFAKSGKPQQPAARRKASGPHLRPMKKQK
jgi:hypothetical protein